MEKPGGCQRQNQSANPPIPGLEYIPQSQTDCYGCRERKKHADQPRNKNGFSGIKNTFNY